MKVAWDSRQHLGEKAFALQRKLDNNGQNNRENLRKASQDFEALFLQQLFGEMRKTVHESDLFGNRDKEKLFQEMLDHEISIKMSQAGGIGLSELIYKQLKDFVPEKESS